jgi:hypothetical protein
VSNRAQGGVRRWGAILFFAAYAVYALGGVLVLAQGAGAALASAVPDLHDTFHVWGLSGGLFGRVALRMADASHGTPGPGQVALDYLFSVVNLGLAFFLLWLRPHDRTARLLAFGLVGAAGVFNLTAQWTFETLPLLPVESVFQAGAHITAGLAYVYALMLFPDGRAVPRWPGPALAAIYAPVTAAAVLLTLRVQGTARPAALILFFGLLTPLAGVAAQGYRFGRSLGPAEHQQARLLFWALLPALVVGAFFVATQGIGVTGSAAFEGRHLPEQPVTVFRVFQPVFAIIPMALFAGILRYRLWDVDRIINRAVVYAAVTAILGGAYLGIVVLLQRVLEPLTRESDLAVAVSTLAVAAAFRPALRRVQAFVDRRFYRRRYDAARTIEQFTACLRDQVDLDSLRRELEGVVLRTMQPSQVSLWLRSPDGNGHTPVTVPERSAVRKGAP